MGSPTVRESWPCSKCGAEWPSPMRFCGECGAALEQRRVRRHDGEMRVLSIVFCDLVGSTELSTRLDLEDFRDLIRDYHNACRDAVTAFGGHVIQFLGDGILASFGSHRALEDSTRRAVDAALEMVRLTAGLSSPDGRPVEAKQEFRYFAEKQ